MPRPQPISNSLSEVVEELLKVTMNGRPATEKSLQLRPVKQHFRIQSVYLYKSD